MISHNDPYIIPGYHGVKESLLKDRTRILQIWVADGKATGRTKEILFLAKKKNIPVAIKNNLEFTQLLPDITHQGIVAFAERFSYEDLDHIINSALNQKEKALVMAADHITDEGNLGSIIRTACFFGVHGLIIPKDRSADITSTVIKRSSGGHALLPISKVTNLGRELSEMKDRGFWIIGASGDGSESIYDFDWNRNIVLVMGNEQKGLGLSVMKQCDAVLSIPAKGNMESLNVGVACGVILSEITRCRSQ